MSDVVRHNLCSIKLTDSSFLGIAFDESTSIDCTSTTAIKTPSHQKAPSLLSQAFQHSLISIPIAQSFQNIIRMELCIVPVQAAMKKCHRLDDINMIFQLSEDKKSKIKTLEDLVSGECLLHRSMSFSPLTSHRRSKGVLLYLFYNGTNPMHAPPT
jgi:hypothetical protein